MLGLTDVLVYADPFFAGTIYYWLVPGVAVLVGMVLWAVGVPVLGRKISGGQKPGLFKVAVASLSVGTFLALPWLYALACVLRG
jgi:hypothetical protein